VPSLPRVDGGFSEWAASLPDPQGDASQQEVDLTAFDARFSGIASFFYAAVGGRILSGTWVPEGNRAVFVPGGPGPDTDRDTVPDAADPYPFDFNNNLVADADSGGDVDNDGLVDYGQPGGADWWLNTTIPASFPTPYAGRVVTAFIGPWEPPFQTRDDVLRVFVDIDNSSATGYAIANLGADRLVEISGTEGRVRTADFFSFGGSYPGQWSWIRLSPATVATGFSRMEFSVAQNLSASGARFFVEAHGPLGARDDLAGTRGTRGWSDSVNSPAVSSSFDVAPSPILETWRSRMVSGSHESAPLTALTRGAPDPPRVLDIGGNQKLYLRDTNHGTETACGTNKVASSTQGAGALKTVTLAVGQDACWYADSTTGTTIPAGSWESLLDVSPSTYFAFTGAFNIGTGGATTTVPVTGVGFQPKVLLFWWSGRTESTDTAGAADHQRGFGFAVSTTDRRAGCSWSEDAVATAQSNSAHRDDAAICSTTGPTDAIDGLADLNSMDADGFTMIIDDAFATNLRIGFLALGGTTITNAATGMFNEAAVTFPQVGGSATSSRTTNAIDDVVTLPASVASGDLVLVFHYSGGGGTRTFPSPWVEIKDVAVGVAFNTGIAYLIASGGETSVTVTKSATQRFSAIAIRITAASWHGTTPPEVSTGATGDSNIPNPDAVTASWGSADNLFVAVTGYDTNIAITGYPTNYGSNQINSPSSGGSGRGGVATRELAASNDNPGTFTLFEATEWWAGTVVVRPAATGNQDVTTVGFQPDALVLFSAMISADPPGLVADSKASVGLAAGAGNPVDIVWSGGSDDGVSPSQTQSTHRTGESIHLYGASISSLNGRAEVDGWLSNGFSLSWNAVSASVTRRIHYLAIKGGNYAVGDFTTSTVLDTDIVETGFGFSPKGALFISHNKAQSGLNAVQADDERSMGAFSSATARHAQCVVDVDAGATTVVGTAVEHDEVYCNLSTATAIEGLVDIQSVDSDGFTLNQDDPDPAASFVGYIAFGMKALAFDATSSTTANGNPVSWSHTTVSQTDGLIVVGISLFQETPDDTVVTAVSYGGFSLTKIRHDVRSRDARSELWYRIGTLSGAQTVSVTMDAAQKIVAGAVSFTGAHQTSPIGNHNGANAFSDIATVTLASAAGEIVVDTVAVQRSLTLTVGSGQTERWNATSGPGAQQITGGGSTEAGAASVTMSWSISAVESWAISAVSIKPAVVEYDVYLEIWNKAIDSVSETIGFCLDVTTSGDDVQCLISGVGAKTLTSDQVVRLRVRHSSNSGTVSIEYDDADFTGDSRATIPPVGIPEFEDIVVPVLATVLVPVAWRWSRRRRRARKALGGDGGPDVPLLSVTH
jgi:hypothetical protein